MNADIFARVNRQLVVRGAGVGMRGNGRRDNNFRLARVYHHHNRVNQDEPAGPPIKREVRSERVLVEGDVLRSVVRIIILFISLNSIGVLNREILMI